MKTEKHCNSEDMLFVRRQQPMMLVNEGTVYKEYDQGERNE